MGYCAFGADAKSLADICLVVVFWNNTHPSSVGMSFWYARTDSDPAAGSAPQFTTTSPDRTTVSLSG